MTFNQLIFFILRTKEELMKTPKSLHFQILTCILIFLGYLLLSYTISIFMVNTFTVNSNTKPFLILVQQLFMCMVLMILMIWLNMTGILTEQKKTLIPSLWIGGFLFLYSLLVICIKGYSYGFPDIFFLSKMFFIGFTEEVLFRGIFGKILWDENHLIRTAFISSLLFGLAHASNILSGATPLGVFIQIMGTFAIGFYMMAIFIRTKNIWAVIILHTMNDYAVQMGSQSGNSVAIINSYHLPNLLPFVLYTLLGLFILRKTIMEETSIDTERY